ncbi:hypothetical protein Esti_001019 [Eimeria stiedai]
MNPGGVFLLAAAAASAACLAAAAPPAPAAAGAEPRGFTGTLAAASGVMKDFAYFFLPLGGLLTFLLVLVPTRRTQRLCVSFCCLHVQLGPLRVGVAASVCLYSLVRFLVTAAKLRQLYAAAAHSDPAAALAAAAAGLPAAAAARGGNSPYQLRHERNLWIELFCLVVWLFAWRCGKLLGTLWQRIEALQDQVQALRAEKESSDPGRKTDDERKAVVSDKDKSLTRRRKGEEGMIELVPVSASGESPDPKKD